MKENYTRISDILSVILDFSYIDPTILEAKKNIGTSVHAVIEAYLNDPTFDPYLLTEREKKYFDSFLRWKNDHNIYPVFTEQRLYCEEYRITGQIDLIAKVNNKLSLIDFKTTSSIHTKIWALQGAFYYYLVRKEGVKIEDSVTFINLKENKPPKTIIIPITKKLMTSAFSLLNVYNHLKK